MGLNSTLFTQLICQMCTKQFCNKQASFNCQSLRLHLLWSQQQTNKKAGMASIKTDLWDLPWSNCVWQGTRKFMLSGQVVVSSAVDDSILLVHCTLLLGYWFLHIKRMYCICLQGLRGPRIPSKHFKLITQQHRVTPQTSWILKSTFTYPK